MKSKVVDLEQALSVFRDGQTIFFSDWHGELSAEEIITGMLEKGVKDIHAVAVSGGMADQGLGRLISAHRVTSLGTTHIGLHPVARDQMFAGELDIEFMPMGSFTERIRCGGYGLGGCLTRTGLGTDVEEGKQKITIKGVEYLVEEAIHGDVAVIKAWKADALGNVKFRLTGKNYNIHMALAADKVVVETEELVEIGELGPDEIDIPAPVVDMVYVKTGEKKPLCPMWQRAKAKAQGGK